MPTSMWIQTKFEGAVKIFTDEEDFKNYLPIKTGSRIRTLKRNGEPHDWYVIGVDGKGQLWTTEFNGNEYGAGYFSLEIMSSYQDFIKNGGILLDPIVASESKPAVPEPKTPSSLLNLVLNYVTDNQHADEIMQKTPEFGSDRFFFDNNFFGTSYQLMSNLSHQREKEMTAAGKEKKVPAIMHKLEKKMKKEQRENAVYKRMAIQMSHRDQQYEEHINRMQGEIDELKSTLQNFSLMAQKPAQFKEMQKQKIEEIIQRNKPAKK